MSTTVDVAFTKQFEVEVHEAYQRRGSKLSNTVRKSTVMGAKDTTFQKAGKGVATTKGRNSQVPVMNVTHTNVLCTLEDYYAGDWSDKLDEMKTNIDERKVLVNAGAWALGRRSDDLIITAAMNSLNTIAHGGTNLTRAKIDTAVSNLGNRDVMFDGDIWGVVSHEGWVKLLNLNEFVSSDFVGDHPLAKEGLLEVRRWMGINWMAHSGLKKTGNIRSCLIYHRSALGLAVGAEVTTDITWHGDRASHFVNSWLSQGSCLIDTDGVEIIEIDETA